MALFLICICVGCKTKRIPENYTDAYSRQFWQTNVRHQVFGILHDGVPDMPEVDAEVKRLRKRIREIYGTETSLRPLLGYCTLVSDPMDAYVSNGVPTIEISLSALVDIHLFEYLKSNDSRRYETIVLIYLCHQLERLASEQVSRDRAGRENKKLLAERQQRAWALTCSAVIVPLTEKYGASLYPEEREMYELWIRSIHSTQMPLWDRHIRKRYMSYWPP